MLDTFGIRRLYLPNIFFPKTEFLEERLIPAFNYLLQLLGMHGVPEETIRTAFGLSAFFAFALGTCVGSFLNVCIYRMPLAGRSVSRPTFSFCFTCGSTLRWYDNIPLFSYLWLMGRCRRCGQVYGSRYFWIELSTGGVFLFLYLVYGPSLAFLSSTMLASCLLVSFFTDIDEYIIPDETSLFGFIAGIVIATLAWLIGGAGHPLAANLVVHNPLVAILGGAVGAGVLYLIGVIGTLAFRKEAMGFGDVKLLGMMGAFIGPTNVILTIFLASFIGAIFGLSQMLVKVISGEKRYAHIPFGPYLALAGFLTLFFGDALLALLIPPETWEILQESWRGQ